MTGLETQGDKIVFIFLVIMVLFPLVLGVVLAIIEWYKIIANWYKNEKKN